MTRKRFCKLVQAFAGEVNRNIRENPDKYGKENVRNNNYDRVYNIGKNPDNLTALKERGSYQKLWDCMKYGVYAVIPENSTLRQVSK